MKKQKKLVILSGLIFVGSIILLAYIFLYRDSVANNRIVASVTSVVDKPNHAEDGYYEIIAKDNSGRQYTINATGYLNTPLSPDSQGEACVDIPQVSVGDTISFNLPKAEGQSNTFDICYKKNVVGYYFRVE